MSNCCVICYKLLPPGRSLKDPILEDVEGDKKEQAILLQRFFTFLERHLNEVNQQDGRKVENDIKTNWTFPMDEVLGIGMTACPDCRQVIGSFCELYDELKKIELLLNWKLWTVKNLMSCAQRVTPRVRDFRECVRKLEVGGRISSGSSAEEVIALILNSKKSLIAKCSRKLKNSLPRVSAVKWPVKHPNQHNTSVTMAVSLSDVIQDMSQNEVNSSVSPLSIGNGDYVPQLPANSNLDGDNRKLCSVADVNGVTNLKDPVPDNQCMKLTEDGLPDKEFTQSCPGSEWNVLNNDAIQNERTEMIDLEKLPEVGNGKCIEVLELNSPSNDKLSLFAQDDMDIEPNMDTAVTKESVKNKHNLGNGMHGKDDGIVYSSDQDEDHLSPDLTTLIRENLEHDDVSEPISVPPPSDGATESDIIADNIPPSPEENVVTENLDICSEPTTSRCFLRTVHRCTNCRRTFSSKERLANHRNECCNSVEDGEKDNGCTQAIEKEDEEMDIENDEDDLDTDTTGTSDEDEESSYSEEIGGSESEVEEMELGPGESCRENDVDEQIQVHHKKIAKGKASTSMIGKGSGIIGTSNQEKPWSCPDCSVSYNSQGRLRKHLLLKHPTKWKELKNNRKYYTLPKYLGSSTQSTSGNDRAAVAYRFKCTCCNLMFPNMHSLLLHRQRKHPPPPNNMEGEEGRTAKVKMLCFTQAPISNRSIRAKFAQPFATLEVPDNGIFPCTKKYCRLPFYSKEDLDCHLKVHGEFKCQFCPAVKKFAPNLAEHELTHSKLIKREPGSNTGENLPVGKWECARCAKTFPNKPSYTAHHLTAHLSLNLVSNVCAICGSFCTMSRKLDLVSHYKSHHDIERVDPKSVKRCQLENCKAYFLKLSRLIQHVRERHGASQKQIKDIIAKERQMYGCEDCNSTFTTGPSLRAHRVKFHVEVENLLHCKVDKCKFSCETLQELEDHSYYRHTFKSMQFIDCPKCSKACNGMSELKMHMRSHLTSSDRIKRSCRRGITNLKNTSSYRFKCPDCALLFRELDKLLLHRKDLHNGDHQTQLLANASVGHTTKLTVEIISFPNKVVPTSLEKVKAFKVLAKIQIADKIYLCPVSSCQLPFYFLSDLETHSKLHGEFECNFCDFAREYAPELADHELIHSDKVDQIGDGKSSWDCLRCKLKFPTKKMYLSHHLATHLNLVSAEEEKCAICGLFGYFSRRQHTLIKHYKNSHGLSDNPAANLYTCTVNDCGAYFVKRKALSTHIKLQHNREEVSSQRFKCKDCNSNKTYKDIYGLRYHRKTAHPTTYIFRCSIPKCSVSCETQEDLQSHMQSRHSSSKMDFVECPKCKKCLNGTGSLRRHMKIHSASRFVCETCGKIFPYRFSLEVHSLSHSGPESWEYICEVCSKKCMTQQKLDEHKRTHSKEKPFECQICGQKYAHRHNLRIHVNSKHGDVTEDRPTRIRKRKPESSIVGTSNKRKRKRKPRKDKGSDYSTD